MTPTSTAAAVQPLEGFVTAPTLQPVQIEIVRECAFEAKPLGSSSTTKSTPRDWYRRGHDTEGATSMLTQPTRELSYVLIPLYNRADAIVGWAKVDASDADHVARFRWRRTYYGYAITGSAGKKTDIPMHRMILGLKRGNPTQGDHRYGDRLDCRRANLRLLTNAQNAQNQAARGGTSRHRGVSLRKDTGRWEAYVKVNYKRYSAGTAFATEQEAVDAVLALRARLMPFDEPSRHA